MVGIWGTNRDSLAGELGDHEEGEPARAHSGGKGEEEDQGLGDQLDAGVQFLQARVVGELGDRLLLRPVGGCPGVKEGVVLAHQSQVALLVFFDGDLDLVLRGRRGLGVL